MELEEPKKEEKKVGEVAKKEKKSEPKKEKLVVRIIYLLFGGPSNDLNTQNMKRGLIERIFLNTR